MRRLPARLMHANGLKLGLVVGAFFVLLLIFRNGGLLPSVFADEWYYSLLSRSSLRGLTDPDYLYLRLFRVTNYCGDGFLECSRALNVALFTLGSVFIYLTAKRSISQNVAIFIAVGTLLAPINVYTAYFMPEATYFCVFWILTWFTLTADARFALRFGAGVGALIAVLALVKPHAMFLLPAIIVVSIYRVCYAATKNRVSSSMRVAVAVIVALVVVRILLGYAFAGVAGVSLLGARYSSMASESGASAHLLESIQLSAEVLGRHLIALALIFGVPIGVLLDGLLDRKWCKAEARGNTFSAMFYLAFVLITLLVVTSVFTVTANGMGPYETLNRLHMRYYNFVFPLFFIVTASVFSSLEELDVIARAGKTRRVGIAIALGALAIFGVVRLLHLSTPSIIDGPEIRAFTYNRWVFVALSVCGLMALLTWVWNRRLGGRTFIFLFFPLFLIGTFAAVNSETRQRLTPALYDQAGMFARDYLPPSDRAHLVVVGSDIVGMFTALFYIDNVNATSLRLEKDAPLRLASIPVDRDWALVVGEHGPLPATAIRSRDGSYALIQLNQRIDFTHASWPGVVSRTSGLSSPEATGTWSDDDKVEIDFEKPLPKHFIARLTALAFGPDVGQPFSMRVGTETKTFFLKGTATTVDIPYMSGTEMRSIEIIVPRPASPKSIGIGGDERRIGVYLMNLRIMPVN